MKVLVTGGSGFIGRSVLEELLLRGHDVISLDLIEPSIAVPFVVGDIRDFETLRNAARGVNAIIHLAAIVSAVEAMEKPLDTFRTNVEGTLNVAETARRENAKVVYAGSVAVYGEPKSLPVSEDHPVHPTNIYGSTKLAGESILLGYSGSYGLPVTSLRFFNVYGPHMKPGPYAGVIYKFLERLKGGKPLRIEGDGKQTRDFVYVGDVARAVVLALESDATGVYNVGTGREISILELARLLFSLTGMDTGLEFAPPRPGDIRRSRADISKIRRLGWEPSIDLERGLRRTIEWFGL
ncbi:MAG: NAD-dependent epimerase/dehydratase family protein [Candidatus Korarchaeota archaeon]|nr:NAD-dependent epimerase/dehydratase family protein [Candidatus Korarchaeota archaeon]